MIETRFVFFASAYTTYVANSAPAKAAKGNSKGPVKLFSSGLNFAAITKTKEAPSAAPALVPTKPGSTMGFLNKPCINTPLTDNIAPVMAHKSTLGNRSCRKTPS